jgi:glucose-1-phosphate adenylyltransferase
MDDELIAIILGGGRGTRLFPLTFKRSKPAVPIAGKYRLIDIPISNCINSNIRRMFVLTQFNSESLNQHISRTYKFDIFSDSFVSILAAEQTEDDGNWFQGTADAVRQSLRHMRRHQSRHILILSGDQLYKMDYRTMLDTHRRSGAQCTVGVIPVAADQASQFGILKMNAEGRIVHFEEKPPADRLPHLVSEIPGVGPGFLASMGIYIFERKTMERELTQSGRADFGRHIIPDAVPKMHVQAHVHQGYWEDVGTIRSYFQANLALTDPLPPFDFYQAGAPVYSHPRFLPASKVSNCTVHNALISEGCIILGAEIDRSVIGIRARIGSGAQLHNALVLGADAYETLEELESSHGLGVPPMGIGSDSLIRNAIIDKNARIGNNVTISPAGKPENVDHELYFIRDGIVIIPKNGVVPHGTVI